MCGRYTVRGILPVAELFGVALPPEFVPRYNVAPTQNVPVVRAAEGSRRRADLLRWGLVPSWAKDPAIGNRMINARAETVAEKPAFRTALAKRRCLVAADGFYEWRPDPAGGKRKQPHLIRMRGDQPFAIAGLWERWGRGDEHVESFTILTTSANELVAPIHDRMPVIIAPADFDRWLDPTLSASDVQGLLAPFPADEMEAFPVSTRVNSPSNDDASCTEAWG